MATKKKAAVTAELEPPAAVEPPATTIPAEAVDLAAAQADEESMTINDFVSVVAEGKAFAVRFVTFDDGESMMTVGFPDLAGAEAFAEKCIAKLKQDLAHLKAN